MHVEDGVDGFGREHERAQGVEVGYENEDAVDDVVVERQRVVVPHWC